MPKTVFEHRFDEDDKVLFADGGDIREGKIVAMQITHDWSHDNRGLDPETTFRYTVKATDEPKHGAYPTFTRHEDNLEPI